MASIDRRGFFQAAGVVGVGAAVGPAFAGTSGAAPVRRPRSQTEFLDHNPRWRVKPFPLHRVSITDGTVFAEKRDRVLSYAAAYPVDRVLHNFRVTAGLPTPTARLRPAAGTTRPATCAGTSAATCSPCSPRRTRAPARPSTGTR